MPEDDPLELNRAVPGGRIEMYAVRDEDHPGGWFYRFQYYDPGNGEILRYDNAHDDPDLGWHHRHVASGEDSEIPFHNISAHVDRFFQEVAHLADVDDPTHD